MGTGAIGEGGSSSRLAKGTAQYRSSSSRLRQRKTRIGYRDAANGRFWPKADIAAAGDLPTAPQAIAMVLEGVPQLCRDQTELDLLCRV